MQIFDSPNAARQFVLDQRAAGRSVGVVPTMGALHDGHIALVKRSVERCDVTVASIFVNPTQFGIDEDLDRYPRTIDQDQSRLIQASCDAVFLPTESTMYPTGHSTTISPPDVAMPLEGICRPGHFAGVATVVTKLMGILPGTHAFFGRKDFQQLRVIQAVVRDLNLGIDVVGVETVREPDGLAMSSRNRFLTPDQRLTARLVSAALSDAQQAVASGCRDIHQIQTAMRGRLSGNRRPVTTARATPPGEIDAPGELPATGEIGTADTPAAVDKIDYAVVVDSNTLMPLSRVESSAVALIAVFVGSTRLIDNRILSD